MTEYQKEQIENIRRQADNGIETALITGSDHMVDYFQAILDLVEAIKNE